MSEELLEEAEQLLRLISRAERLEAFPRTGWQICGVQHPESVASHSYMVALVALWLADRLPEQVDTEEVLRIALVHDLPEAMLTDLPRPVKALLGREACQAAEEQAAKTIFSHLQGWQESFERYQDAQSLEARLVKAADRIQMLAKALQYQVEHRGRTERFFCSAEVFEDYGIPLLATIFQRLRERFAAQQWFEPEFD